VSVDKWRAIYEEWVKRIKDLPKPDGRKVNEIVAERKALWQQIAREMKS
jgi:hypothetical protein